VNFVGHIAVGRVLHDRPAADASFLLGTGLPDFAAMARVRIARVAGPLGDGMDVHHRTDAVFHRGQWFLDSEHELLADLERAGFPRGAALACAHVGIELLLDGALVRDPSTASAVRSVYVLMAAPPGPALAAAPMSARAHWADSLSGIAARLDPEGYRDPHTVAVRLHRVTSRRPRLAFAPDLVPALAERLAAHQPRIGAAAPGVLERVSAAVRATLS
jgi:hypothetical protein